MIDWKDFDDAIEDHQRHWALIDKTLYGSCKKYPSHDDIAEVKAKLWIIGRTYATRIEGNIPKDGTQGGALKKLADLLHRKSKSVDGIIQALPQGKALTPDKMEKIVLAHSRFSNLIRPVLREGRSPRSFVSKYMHFHCPAVPIYDSIAMAELRSLYPWKKSYDIFKTKKNVDEQYGRHVKRFWQFYKDAQDFGINPTVKQLDAFLLWWASD